MPELPEVETIVRGLNKKVIGLKITNAWTDWPRTIKTHNLKDFVRETRGLKILRAHRRAKYIMLDLSGGKTLIIHQKISGHLLYGKWKMIDGKPVADIEGPIKTDPYNRFIRFILYFNNGYMLGLSDVRRFGKVFLDPFVIAGIGNIYADEILWYAKILPLRKTEELTDRELGAIFKNMGLVLKKAIAAKGNSQQDYRTIEGRFGTYQNMERAYQRTGEKCFRRDGGVIKRVKMNNRSAHFCPICQK